MQENDPNRKDVCGLPGINGGYIDNPNIRFGVNCYGYKPKITPIIYIIITIVVLLIF